MMGKIANNATSSIDIDNIAISNNQLTNSQFIQNQNQSLSVPLAQQSVSGTQQPLLGSLAQQSCIETRRLTDLNITIDIMDDTSSTLVRTLDVCSYFDFSFHPDMSFRTNYIILQMHYVEH